MLEQKVTPLDIVQCADALDYLRGLPSDFVNCIVTSPPYFGLRDYGIAGQIGLEDTPAAYVERLRGLFAEARRVLRDNGVLWLNLGDTYIGGGRGGNPTESEYRKQATNAGSLITQRTMLEDLPAKNLIGIPWRVAFALQDDGWILRSDVIWHKPNPMPESVTDRPTKAHEYVFLFAKSPRYWYDADAIAEESVGTVTGGFGSNYDDARKSAISGGKPSNVAGMSWSTRNARTVWTIATQPNSLAHFAMMTPKLARRCILAGCPRHGIVLDPFMGTGTTAIEAIKEGRHYVGCDLNPEYVEIVNKRLAQPHAVTLPLMESSIQE